MTLGLKDLYYAKVTETNGVETFADPAKLAEAMTADLSVTTAEGVLYADDAVSESVKEFVKGALKLGVKEIAAADMAVLLGQTVDDDDVVYAGAGNEAPYVAIGFRAKKTGGKYRYIWLYKVKFKVPNEKYQTKGESITFTTPEIEGEFFALKKNGHWKADLVAAETDTVAAGWFTNVKEIATA